MIYLYPRLKRWRPTRAQVAWRSWNDLHPKPMAGVDVLEVGRPSWWQRILYVRRGFVSLSFGFGALSVWWRVG